MMSLVKSTSRLRLHCLEMRVPLSATKAPSLSSELMSHEVRSVLWIDPHLEYRSPSMQHLLHALPRLRAAGWKIEAWCLRSDVSPQEVAHTFFPVPKWIGPFELLYFTLAVNLYGLWRVVTRRPITAKLIHASSGTYFGAQLISVHFVNAVWIVKQCRLGVHSFKQFAGLCLSLCGAVIERSAWWSPAVRKILTVSESIAEEVRERCPKYRAVQVLPNSYDETRFHPGVRDLYRAAMRRELGFGSEHFAFIFVSQGHHQRKGFWLAIEALARLRAEGRKNLHFLVVGGTSATVDTLRARLERDFPDWVEWVSLVGMQPRVEKYYAAADAFLFPSYFEAFSLAEIEAAACGLPLLLTPHHGSEMTLNAGVPGAFLSFDPSEMSRQIAEFLDNLILPPFLGAGLGLTRAEYASRLLALYEEFVEAGRP